MKFSDITNKLTRRSRMRKKLPIFTKDIDTYLKLSEEEFLLEYIDISTMYEKELLSFSSVVISIIVVIFLGAGSYIMNIVNNLLLVMTSNSDVRFEAIFVIAILIMLFVILFIIISTKINNIAYFHRKKLLLEDIKNKRENGKNENINI